jgi:hypothetical protein
MAPVVARDIRLSRDDRSLTVGITDEVAATIDLASTVPDTERERLASLFNCNRSGIGHGRRRICESVVTKDHWRMTPHATRVDQASFAKEHDGRLEFAFDASMDRARWAWPRSLG